MPEVGDPAAMVTVTSKAAQAEASATPFRPID
jgi:hypothetical protein